MKDYHDPPPMPERYRRGLFAPVPPASRSVKGDTPRPDSAPATFSVGYGPKVIERAELLNILVKLEKGAFPELTYVGKQYTKADLIKDLQDLLN